MSVPRTQDAEDSPALGWRYRLLVENTADVVIHTIEGVLQWVSPSIEELTGWSPAELIGSATAHLWHPEDLGIAVRQRDATYAGRATRNTLRLRCKNGEYLWLDVALKPYLEPDGRTGAVGSLRDVSALVLARAQAEHQGRQLQRVFDSMIEPHLLLSPVVVDGVSDFEVTAANAVAAEVLGRDRSALIGRLVSSLVTTQSGRAITSQLAGWLDAGEPVVLNGWGVTSPGGEQRYFDVSVSVVDGALLIAWRDVTQRHTSAASLEASEAAYRLLAENAADITMRLDAGDCVTWASPSTHRLLGYLPEDLVGPLRPDLIHPDDQGLLESALRTLRASGTCVVSREVRLHHRHGSYAWWHVSARRTSDDPAEAEIVLALSNIDAEKRAELAVDEEQSLRVAVLDSMLDPHVLLRAVTDVHGDIIDFRYVDANPSACEYMGMSAQQLLGCTVVDLLPAHAKTGLLELYIDTMATGEPLILNDYEYPHEIRAATRLFDIRAVKVADCLSFTWRDVTQRHEDAQRLVQSEARYRLLAENIGDVIVSAKPTGEVDYVSASLTSVLGWRPDELLGRRVWEFMHPHDIEQASQASAALRAGSAIVSGRGRLKHKDGTWRWIGAVARAVRNPSGELVSTIGTWRDIQAEVEFEHRLAASERRFRILAEHSLDIVATVALDGGIEWISPSVQEVLGWPPEHYVGRQNLELVDPRDRAWFTAEVKRLAAQGLPSRLTVRMMRSDGTCLWMEAVGRQMTDPESGQPVRIVRLRDVQAAHVANEKLAAQQARLAATVDGVADPLLLLDPVYDADGAVIDFTVEAANSAACRFLNVDHDLLVGGLLLFRAPDLMASGVFHRYVEALSSDQALTMDDVRTPPRDGQPELWFDHRATSRDGRLVATWRDVTDRHIAARDLREALASTRLLAENATDVVFRTDAAGVLRFCSDGAQRLLGYRPEELVGTAVTDRIHPDDRGGFDGLLDHVGRIPAVRARLRAKDGSFVWVEFNTRGVADEHAKFAGLVGGWRDVEAEVAIQQTLRDQARLDSLTGLINRGEVFRRLTAILSHPRRTGTEVAVAFADLDNLKEINDRYGHAAGDALIRTTAERLRSAVRADDIVARIGGDELLIILPGVHNLDEAVTVVDTLRKIVALPVEGTSVLSTVSIGVTVARPGDTCDEVVARADQGMYLAKQPGDRVVAVP